MGLFHVPLKVATDQMQSECHGSCRHSQKIDVFLTISRTTQRVRGALPPVPVLVEDGPMLVCVCSMR